MKKIILSLVIGIFTLGFVSCKNEHESNMNKMSTEVKKFIEDNAFKDNETFGFIEYTPIDYIMKPETYIDSIRLGRNSDMIKMYTSMCESSIKLANISADQYKIYVNLFGINEDITKMQKKEVEEKIEESKQYKDSLDYYWEQDSLIRKKIAANVNPDSIYMFKVFIKGTSISNKNNETYNICDTFYYFFNKELKPINL